MEWKERRDLETFCILLNLKLLFLVEKSELKKIESCWPLELSVVDSSES